LKNDIHLWKDLIFNDFESSVFESYPQIASIKKMLYEMGATYAQMSGSGAACYGIFNEKPKMDELPNGWISFGGVL
jgi:4-diphosphocytidyl-2-C-methyl-D-erythritol kinase